MRSIIFIISFSLLGFLPVSFAENNCDINSVLSVLTLNQNVQLKAGEKPIYGTVLKKGTQIPKLTENGTYVFLIDQDENIVISHRYPDLDEVTPVVTHRSLLNQLRKTTKKEPKLLALGEINIDHGHVSSINNKAGTAYMNNSDLPHVAKFLKQAGLPIEKNTSLQLFNEVQKGHDAEHVAAAFRIQTLKDPHLRALNIKLTEFRRKMQLRFPDKEPGMVDWTAFTQSTAHVSHGLSVETLSTNEYKMMPVFGWMENYNDRYRVLPILKQGLSNQELDQLIEELPRFEGLFNR